MDNRQRPRMTRPEEVQDKTAEKPKKQRKYPNRPGFDPLQIFMPGFFGFQKKDEDERKYALYLKNIEYHNIDLVLLIIVVMLCALGLLMMFSASYAWAINATKDNNGEYYVVRQAIFVAAGFGLIILLSSRWFDYHMLRSKFITYIILLGSMGLVGLVLVAGIGDDANGA